MKKDSDVKFIRVRGRVIPVRRKTDQAIGAGMLASGIALSVGSGIQAGKILRKSEFAFGRSANLRGASKLVMGKSSINSTYNKIIRDAAAFKIQGKRLSKKSSAILLAGTTVAGIVAGIGANRVIPRDDKNKDVRELDIELIGTAVGFAGFFPFGKISKIRNVLKLARSKKPVSDVFKAWSKSGSFKTKSTVNKFTKASYKGVRPKSKDTFSATQQDMFKAKSSFNVKKWFKNL